MSLREYIQYLDQQKKLLRVSEPISKRLEISGVLKQMEPAPVLFEHVRESAFPVVGNLFCSKAAFAEYFGIQVNEIIPFLTAGIQNRKPSEVIDDAPCQEVVELEPDLDRLASTFTDLLGPRR